MSKSQKPKSALPTTDEIEERIRKVTSDRKVRPVVTRTGQRARGLFPSIKSRETRYESLVEEDALRIFEVATAVRTIHSHPFVLKLADNEGGDGRLFHYTPDVFVTFSRTAALAEVKGDWLLKLSAQRTTLARNLLALRKHGIPMMLLAESELHPAGLQRELKELLRDRPVGARRRTGIDSTLWDPLGAVEPTADILRRWRQAQKECDELLDRVMRRDPDEVIDSLTN